MPTNNNLSNQSTNGFTVTNNDVNLVVNGNHGVNIGTGTGQKTIEIGNNLSNSSIQMYADSLGISMQTTSGGTLNGNIDGSFTINTGSAQTITLDGTNNTIDIGAGATGDRTITIGNFGTSSSLALKAGGSDMTFSTTNGDFTFDSTNGLTDGDFTLNSGTGTVNFPADAGTATVNIAPAGVKTLTLGSTAGASATSLLCGSGAMNITSTNGTMNISSGTGSLNISNNANATTVNLGTGAASKTVTIGSTNTTSTLNLQSGSGGINIPQFDEGALVTDSTGNVTAITGTAGYVLTANAAGSAPTFQASTVMTTSVTLTSSQIKNLIATPITLIPAQGPNTIVAVYNLSVYKKYGSNVFTGTGNIFLKWGTVNTPTSVMGNSRLVSAESTFNTAITGISFTTTTDVTNITNADVLITQDSGAEFGGNASNDTTIKVGVIYQVFSLV